MEHNKQCSNCEFNSDGICIGHGDLYDYGEKTDDDTKSCKSWSGDLYEFEYQIINAPRFLTDALNDKNITYDEFLVLVDDYISGHSVSIDIFDAIKEIYGLSMVDIAVFINVTYGVVYRAKKQGFTSKRLKQFSSELYIDEAILKKTMTSDIEELKKSRDIFLMNSDVSRVDSMPEWKTALSLTLSELLNCSISLARDFARIDKLYWINGMPMDSFTKSEKRLIDFIIKQSKFKHEVYDIAYFLDIATTPHLRINTQIY